MRIYMQNANPGGRSPRFCQVMLQPDLLHGWNMIREVGYQGSKGKLQSKHFDNLEAAQDALIEERDKQIRNGFRVVYVQGENSAP